MDYYFDWSLEKEKQNIRKHNVSFRQAATVFYDPGQLSIFAEGHSNDEERWLTIGLDSTGVLRVVIHTFEIIDESSCQIRIISACKATVIESRQYQGE